MKTRVKLKHFMSGSVVSPSWIIEALIDRRWGPVGDDDGIKKFATSEAAEAEATRIKETLARRGSK